MFFPWLGANEPGSIRMETTKASCLCHCNATSTRAVRRSDLSTASSQWLPVYCWCSSGHWATADGSVGHSRCWLSRRAGLRSSRRGRDGASCARWGSRRLFDRQHDLRLRVRRLPCFPRALGDLQVRHHVGRLLALWRRTCGGGDELSPAGVVDQQCARRLRDKIEVARL